MSQPPLATTQSPYWIEHARRQRIADANSLLAELQEDADMRSVMPVEPCRIPPECRTPIVIKPGSHNAAAAFKAGREDEYIDAMQGRYGGEW